MLFSIGNSQNKNKNKNISKNENNLEKLETKLMNKMNEFSNYCKTQN